MTRLALGATCGAGRMPLNGFSIGAARRADAALLAVQQVHQRDAADAHAEPAEEVAAVHGVVDVVAVAGHQCSTGYSLCSYS